ncbi:MAG: hypothetical protein QOE35_1910 [Actinomycetota bacterium]|jgi:UDP:flavonoid glycosyltransferase YjiC (YdhE family)
MRVVVTTFPSYGHFHPVAPLALALREAGHDVQVATDAGFGRWVEACGLPVLPAGRPQAEMVAQAASFPSAERAVRLFTTVSTPPFARDLLRAAVEWQPDLVVSEEAEYAGPLVASMLGLPCATHSWPGPARPADERAARVGSLVDVWREFGQREPPRLYGRPYLDCCPPPLQSDAIEGIDGLVTVRPVLFDGPPGATSPLVDDVVHPVVFMTLGTVPLFARPEMLRLIAESVAPSAGTVIVATGPHVETVVPAQPGVRVARYVPLSAVLPVTDLVISHGGAGTTVACVLMGVPHLVIPQGAPSQDRSATSVERLGVGLSLLDRPVTSATIAAATAQLLHDSGVRERIDAVRATLDRLPGPDEVVGQLEALG